MPKVKSQSVPLEIVDEVKVRRRCSCERWGQISIPEKSIKKASRVQFDFEANWESQLKIG